MRQAAPAAPAARRARRVTPEGPAGLAGPRAPGAGRGRPPRPLFTAAPPRPCRGQLDACCGVRDKGREGRVYGEDQSRGVAGETAAQLPLTSLGRAGRAGRALPWLCPRLCPTRQRPLPPLAAPKSAEEDAISFQKTGILKINLFCSQNCLTVFERELSHQTKREIEMMKTEKQTLASR